MSIIAAIAAALWQSSVGRPAIIAGGLLLGGFAFGFLKGYHYADAPGAALEARQACNDHWQKEIGKANAQAEDWIDEAIKAGGAVRPLRDRSELERMCSGPAADPDCRHEELQQLPRDR